MDSRPDQRHMGRTFKGHDPAKIMEQIVDYLNGLPDHDVRAMSQSVNANAVRDPYQVMVLVERRAG